MKLRKIMAGIVATAVAATMAVAASAENAAFVMYADADWYPSLMDATGVNEDAGLTWTAGTQDISADGTYTVSISDVMGTSVDEETGDEVTDKVTAEGAVVFCVDIEGLADAVGCGISNEEEYDKNASSADKMALAKAKGIEVTDVSIKQVLDGAESEVAVDNSKVLFGDIEGNGKLRIEIYNEYGETKADAPINMADIYFNDSLSVTFTITGIDAALAGGEEPAETEKPADTEAPAETEAPTTGDSTKPNTNTGVEGIAVVAGVAVLATGAIIVAKKRK